MSIISLIWLILGIILIGAEFIMPAFVAFFFGIGAIIIALLTFIIPPLQGLYILQAIIWLIMSISSLGFLRKYFSPIFKGKEIKGSADDDFRSQRAIVTEDILENREGRVRFQGTTWKAIAFDEQIKTGETVQILQKDNLTLIVTKID